MELNDEDAFCSLLDVRVCVPCGTEFLVGYSDEETRQCFHCRNRRSTDATRN